MNCHSVHHFLRVACSPNLDQKLLGSTCTIELQNEAIGTGSHIGVAWEAPCSGTSNNHAPIKHDSNALPCIVGGGSYLVGPLEGTWRASNPVTTSSAGPLVLLLFAF